MQSKFTVMTEDCTTWLGKRKYMPKLGMRVALLGKTAPSANIAGTQIIRNTLDKLIDISRRSRVDWGEKFVAQKHAQKAGSGGPLIISWPDQVE